MSQTTAETPTTIAPQPGPQERFLSTNADIAIYGGSAGGGKTWALLTEALRHVGNPRFGAVIFRRLSTQITNEGGLWDESATLYPHLGGTPREHDREWRFPSGASVAFRHLQHEADKYGWQGAQIPLIGFDELSHFTEGQFFYLLSRNRSTCGVRPYLRATTNPDARSWVKRFLAPWVDRRFHPAARSGELRWFVRDHGAIRWVEPGTPDAKSVTFVRASVYDNRILLAKDPGYLATLKALPDLERQQLLDGDWDAGEDDNPWQVIPTAWADAAVERWKARAADPDSIGVMTALGMDVAHGGKDQTVLAPRHHDYIGPLHKHPGKATPNGMAAAKLAVAARGMYAHVNVDAIGYGAAAAERLIEDFEAPAYAINVACKSTHTDRSGKYRLVNLRAEMWWRLREALDPDGPDRLCLPPDAELLADLTAPTYEVTPSGIKVEPKADVKARLGRSPDCGDAVALAMLPEAAAGVAEWGVAVPETITY